MEEGKDRVCESETAIAARREERESERKKEIDAEGVRRTRATETEGGYI